MSKSQQQLLNSNGILYYQIEYTSSPRRRSKLFKKLFIEWVMYEYKNTSSKDNNDVINTILKHIKLLKFCTFNKKPSSVASDIPDSYPIILSKEQMYAGVELEENSGTSQVYCVGCIERVKNATRKVIDKRKSMLSNKTQYKDVPIVATERGDPMMRLYLLGFLSSRNRKLITAVEVKASDGIVLGGILIEQPSYILYKNDLSFKIFDIIVKATTPKQQVVFIESTSSPLIHSTTGGGDDDDNSNIVVAPVQIQQSLLSKRNQVYLYLFRGYDVPTIERDRDYLVQYSLEDIVFDRVRFLAKVCKSTRCFGDNQMFLSGLKEEECNLDYDDDDNGNDEEGVVGYFDLPSLTTIDCMIRDRIAIHFLCMICGLTDLLSKWYLDAERLALTLNLATFTKSEKNLSILYNINPHITRIDYAKINPQCYNIEEYTIDETIKSLEIAMEHSSVTTTNALLIQTTASDGDTPPPHSTIMTLATRLVEFINNTVSLKGWDSYCTSTYEDATDSDDDDETNNNGLNTNPA